MFTRKRYPMTAGTAAPRNPGNQKLGRREKSNVFAQAACSNELARSPERFSLAGKRFLHQDLPHSLDNLGNQQKPNIVDTHCIRARGPFK